MQIKILVAEDSATDRMIIKSMLSDYCILTACDGLEAMRLLGEQDDINLLILDLNMPNMDGFEVLRALKADRRYDSVRTIILTNYDELENEIRGLKLGAVDYIRKPIHMDSLRARIDIHTALLGAEHALKQQLGDQLHTFKTVFDQAPIGIVIAHNCDPMDPGKDTDDIKINAKFEQITGRTREELIRLGCAKITHPDDLEEDLKNFRKLMAGEIKMYSREKRYIRPDGSAVWVYMVTAPLALSDGNKCSHICLMQDITKQKAMAQALYESERSKSVLLSHLPGLAYRCNYDRRWTMQYVSKGCLALTGYPPESLLYNRDLSYNDIISPEYREVLWKGWEKVLKDKRPFKYEYEIITASGEKKWVLELGQGIYNDAGEVEALEGIVLDISDRKAVDDALKYNNEHDRWTGLYNRDYLISLLEKDAAGKRRVKRALIGINLRMVQLLTANYGFSYSQNIIKKAAEALGRLCDENHILFHERENRFIFYILSYKNKKELADFAAVIADTLAALLVTERIGGGIGIVEVEHAQEDFDVDLLLRRLLIASEKLTGLFGRDFEVFFYNDELEAMVDRERDIAKALNDIATGEQSGDELFVNYQPIMDLGSGRVFGFEALARLKTEKFGLVPPLEFIPIAEKTKLILPLGEQVIVRAFRFLNRLSKLGYDDINMSINISVIQLLSPDFTSRLLELIREMRINPKNVSAEITESVFSSDYEGINSKLKKLSDAGLHIAIDDFGTGHSSFAREKGLKVDCIKIDKYFVDKLLITDPVKAITGDIISMAHKLGHYTIAEGVEHSRQLKYLSTHKCDKVQGFLISRPLSEEGAILFLKARNPSACNPVV